MEESDLHNVTSVKVLYNIISWIKSSIVFQIVSRQLARLVDPTEAYNCFVVSLSGLMGIK